MFLHAYFKTQERCVGDAKWEEITSEWNIKYTAYIQFTCYDDNVMTMRRNPFFLIIDVCKYVLIVPQEKWYRSQYRILKVYFISQKLIITHSKINNKKKNKTKKHKSNLMRIFDLDPKSSYQGEHSASLNIV